MRDLRLWTIAAGLAAIAGAGVAYVARGGNHSSRELGVALEDESSAAPAPGDDAQDALDAARARLRARAEELRREIDG